MGLDQYAHLRGKEYDFDKDLDMKDMAETLLLQKTAYSVDTVDLTQKLLDQDDQNLCNKVIKKAVYRRFF